MKTYYFFTIILWVISFNGLATTSNGINISTNESVIYQEGNIKSTSKTNAINNNLQLIRKQFIDYHSAEHVNDEDVAVWLNSLSENGTWPDINYKSKRGGSWETRDHLIRLKYMARAYRKPTSKFYEKKKIKQALVIGLNHWVEVDYQNYNWWNMQIGIPLEMAQAYLLLGNELPDSILLKSKTILGRARIDMTGQNKVWLSGNVLMRGLLFNNEQDIKEASKSIWEELRVTNEEGIQVEGSFHQHGPQLQFANYGSSYGQSMVMWGFILNGTSYAMPNEKIEIFGNYLLNGPQWTFWKGLMDLNASGRQYFLGSDGHPTNAIRIIREQMRKMQNIDLKRSQLFVDALDTTKQQIGHKVFWRTAFAVHRRPNWYASIRMSSTRVIGTETANFENMQGRLWGDGTLLTYVDGREYFDIAPLWNWRRLPGTTSDQRIIEVYPTSFNTEYGRSAFAGGVNMGNNGVSAMEFMRESVHANKAWFFEDNAIVCLGSDIYGYSHGDVYTSIQQSHLKGKVETAQGELKVGEHSLNAGSWVHHSGIGYQLLNNTTCLMQNVKGNWDKSFHTFGSIPAQGDVFSLWVNHGKTPKNEEYAYIIYPDVDVQELKENIKNESVVILENSKSIAAISSSSGLKVVFFRPAILKTADGLSIETDRPCILMMQDDKLIVSDPTRYHEHINLSINGKSLKVVLPHGSYAGSQVEVKL